MNTKQILKIEQSWQIVQRWLTTHTEPVASSRTDTAHGLAVRTNLKAGYEPGEQVVFVQPPSYHY